MALNIKDLYRNSAKTMIQGDKHSLGFSVYSILFSWFVLACCVVFFPIRCDLSVDKRFLLPPKNEFLEVKTRRVKEITYRSLNRIGSGK